jgi:hypothetical protein
MATRVAAREMPGLVTLLVSGDHIAVDPIGTLSFNGGEPLRRDIMSGSRR